MKPSPKSPPKPAALLAFGAHPDDLEFGCGGVIAVETRAGRAVHLVVCSRGEAATFGTPAERTAEAEKSAAQLGAALEWLELDGDAHLEMRNAHVLKLAGVIRRRQPGIVLAPSLVENQHPDHARLGRLVRDAARLARYGGGVTPEAEPREPAPVLVNLSAPAVLDAWTRAMQSHSSQMGARQYVELQLTRARLLGLRAGVEYAQALYPNDPLLLDSLAQTGGGARKF